MKRLLITVAAAGTLLAALLLAAFWLESKYPLTKGRPDPIAVAAPSDAGGIEVTTAALYATELIDSQGRKITLGTYADRVLVLNFWATWCAPCREEMPVFDALQKEYGTRLQFIGVAADPPEKVAAFERASPMSYPLTPKDQGAIEMSRRFGNRLGLLPHTVVFAPGGQVLLNRIGVVKKQDIEAILIEKR